MKRGLFLPGVSRAEPIMIISGRSMASYHFIFNIYRATDTAATKGGNSLANAMVLSINIIIITP